MPQRPEEPSFSFPTHLQVISKGFQEILISRYFKVFNIFQESPVEAQAELGKI